MYKMRSFTPTVPHQPEASQLICISFNANKGIWRGDSNESRRLEANIIDDTTSMT